MIKVCYWCGKYTIVNLPVYRYGKWIPLCFKCKKQYKKEIKNYNKSKYTV